MIILAIRRFFSYAAVFMTGFYLGSGGCLDRMLDSKYSAMPCRTKSCLEDIAYDNAIIKKNGGYYYETTNP